MRTIFSKAAFGVAFLFLISCAAVITVSAQDSPQKSVASKKAKFETAAKTDAIYTGAIDAHDKAAAEKMVGKEGSFKGKVAKIFTPRGGSMLILNFDRDYKTAMTAVLKKSDFSDFPDMEQLEGKEIVVSGKIISFHDSPEITLTKTKQIVIIK